MIKNKLICKICDREILETERKYMFSAERPYMNIYFHFDCWMKCRNEFYPNISENMQRLLKIIG